MRKASLLLARYGPKPNLKHDGKIITLASNSVGAAVQRHVRDPLLERWNGEKVHVASSLDCCDREAIGWVATNRHLDGGDIRHLIALSVEARFGDQPSKTTVEWLPDNHRRTPPTRRGPALRAAGWRPGTLPPSRTEWPRRS